MAAKNTSADEAGAHAAERFVVGVSEDFCGRCRAGQKGGSEYDRQDLPGQTREMGCHQLHGVSVAVADVVKDGTVYEQSFSL